MNQTEISFRAQGGATTQTQKFISCLMEANGAWTSLLVLVGAGCGFACHSRASDARRMGYHVENKVVFQPTTKTRESFYRIVP